MSEPKKALMILWWLLVVLVVQGNKTHVANEEENVVNGIISNVPNPNIFNQSFEIITKN